MSKNFSYTDTSSVRRSKLKYFSTTILCSASMLFTGNTALAQDQADAGEEERIVVTGSRLIRSDLSAPSPTAVMDADQLRAAGSITIEETLNELPQLQAAGTAQNNAANSSGSSGILAANLRGLGDTRTLVLVNGRRFIPGTSTGVVDLTNIPDALVKRVEIMTGGASAVYGSDAVAGAVNFILNDSFEGIEAGYQYGQTTAGDGENHKLDITMGGNFADDRGNVVISGSYTKRNPVFMGDRDFSAVALSDRGLPELDPGGSSFIPGTRVSLTETQRNLFVGTGLTDSTCDATGLRFGEGGTPEPFCSPRDLFNYSPLNYLVRPLERFQITTMGRYDVTDNVTAYVETHFAHHRNSYQQAPAAFFARTQGDPDDNLIIPDYANNPILPEPVRDMFLANTAIFDPGLTGNATIADARRRAEELGPRHFAFEKTSFSITGGFKGEYSINDNPWTWDTNYTFQRGTTTELTTGEISSLALTLAMDAVTDVNGNAVCRQNLLANCTPVNIFGVGSIDPATASFIAPPHGSSTLLQRQIATATTTGDLFELPAGAVAAAFGVEYRKDQFDFRPDTAEASGQFGSNVRLPSSDSYDVKEIFMESRIPLLADQDFAHDLAIEVAARYSDYSTIGSGFTWKVGGEWAPVEQFRFRSAFNRAVRAPNLDELFSPVTEGFTGGTDPCAIGDGADTRSDALKQFCVQQGVPAGEIDSFQQVSLGLTEASGGNRNLEEEKSDTFTIGAVWSPEFADGLNLTVDYYKIKVNNAISAINAQKMADACITSGDVNSLFCRNVVRHPTTGQIRRVNAQVNNIASLEVSGIDFQVDYRFDVDALALDGESATIYLQSVIGYQFDDIEVAFLGEPAINCAGHFGGTCSDQGVPITANMKAVFNASWVSGPATVRAQGRYIGGLDRLPSDVKPEPQTVQSQPGIFYFDLNASYRFGEDENIEVFGGITNLFNKQPPRFGFQDVGDSNTDPALYDTIGRRFNMGVRVKF